MKSLREFEKMFSDERLEPTAAFDRRLKGQLFENNRIARHSKRLWLMAASGLMVAVLVVGFSLIRPASDSKLARTVLVKDLYAKALADKLPEQPGVTFWDIIEKYSYGPQAEACSTRALEGSSSYESLLYKKANITAFFSKSGLSDGLDYMAYSEDPEVPAFDTDSLGMQSSSITSLMAMGGELTDVNGRPLADNATVADKTSGSYDLYILIQIEPGKYPERKPGCETQMAHLVFDASKQTFSKITIYNGKNMSADNMAFETNRSITTESGSFESVLPLFEAKGFDLERAKLEMTQQAYVQVVNQAAGYEFFYNKAVLGKASLKEIKNAQGQVVVYSYTYAKQPKVVHKIYTAHAKDVDVPVANIEEFKQMADRYGWKITTDDLQNTLPYPQLPGYPAAPTEYVAAESADYKYSMSSTGTPDIPFAYVEAPKGVGVRYLIDPATGQDDKSLPPSDDALGLVGISVFKPGTKPPVGAG
jgi:hypothetical protein